MNPLNQIRSFTCFIFFFTTIIFGNLCMFIINNFGIAIENPLKFSYGIGVLIAVTACYFISRESLFVYQWLQKKRYYKIYKVAIMTFALIFFLIFMLFVASKNIIGETTSYSFMLIVSLIISLVWSLLFLLFDLKTLSE